MSLKSNPKLVRKYNQIYRQDPMAANLFLLLAELANHDGQVETSPEDLTRLMRERFKDPKAYQL